MKTAPTVPSGRFSFYAPHDADRRLFVCLTKRIIVKDPLAKLLIGRGGALAQNCHTEIIGVNDDRFHADVALDLASNTIRVTRSQLGIVIIRRQCI